ncbi:hypothetical protein [Gilvimarinus agarilyticus]|uniref:hypothetical protein n=1 Tax=Gilvimarinus agarilyticus TaxID=679259 RepID=UPI0005A13DC4|nr:hypothetical protein [Gilvimarinus agarilyticus]
MSFHVALLTFLLVASPLAFCDDISFPVPDYFDLHVVADDMEFNGMNMAVSGFSTTKTAEEVELYYRKEWGEEFRKGRMDKLVVLSHIDDGLLYTVQFNESKNEHLQLQGFLAISNLPGMRSERDMRFGEGFPMLSDTKVVNDMKSNDLGRNNRMLWLTNKSSVTTNYNFYRREFTNDGWSVVHSDNLLREKKAGLALSRSGEMLNISIVGKSSLTQVLAIVTEYK